ncbi:MAG: methyltransferase type 12 [Acidobacteria bacterium]|nr:MAG: methyltransferase type 12 [Acidobacteriota bacterium]
MAANPAQQPNPLAIFDALNAHQHTMALKGAIELEVFTHIADGAGTSAEIAKRANASERGMRILCDFLTIMGFLTKHDGTYRLTPNSALFLNKRSPAYLGSIANFIADESLLVNFRDIAAVVRKGGTINGAGTLEPENPMWVEFARSVAPLAAISAPSLAKLVADPGRRMKVLDIAAGHGLFGIAVARHNRAAEVVAVDWKNVLEVALENARKAGVADRYRTIAGSAFDVDLGSGYDVVLLPNFLHHFDPPTNVGLLKKIRAAMKPGGLVATLEFVPNDDRVTPPVAAAFSMMMLASTGSGDAYTFEEFDRMFRDAGFGPGRIQDLEQSPQQLILTTA